MSLTAPAPTLTDKLVAARDAASVLATATTAVKDAALGAIAAAVRAATDEIVRANHEDLVAGEDGGLSSGLLDRRLLGRESLGKLRQGAREATLIDLEGAQQGLVHDVTDAGLLPEHAERGGP